MQLMLIRNNYFMPLYLLSINDVMVAGRAINKWGKSRLSDFENWAVYTCTIDISNV
jgi:hypothetical protein